MGYACSLFVGRNVHQSMLWGGISLAGPVLTVSTQPDSPISMQSRASDEEMHRVMPRRAEELEKILTRDGQLALTLQESGISLDELTGLLQTAY